VKSPADTVPRPARSCRTTGRRGCPRRLQRRTRRFAVLRSREPPLDSNPPRSNRKTARPKSRRKRDTTLQRAECASRRGYALERESARNGLGKVAKPSPSVAASSQGPFRNETRVFLRCAAARRTCAQFTEPVVVRVILPRISDARPSRRAPRGDSFQSEREQLGPRLSRRRASPAHATHAGG
jgi:hypothetical protein